MTIKILRKISMDIGVNSTIALLLFRNLYLALNDSTIPTITAIRT